MALRYCFKKGHYPFQVTLRPMGNSCAHFRMEQIFPLFSRAFTHKELTKIIIIVLLTRAKHKGTLFNGKVLDLLIYII